MTEATPVVNRHHRVPFDVYIGRGSQWGNPFPLSEGSREEVIRSYEKYLRADARLLSAVAELHGKTLGCFCAPAPCHGDILAAFADSVALDGSVPEESISDRLFPGPKRPRLSFG